MHVEQSWRRNLAAAAIGVLLVLAVAVLVHARSAPLSAAPVPTLPGSAPTAAVPTTPPWEPDRRP